MTSKYTESLLSELIPQCNSIAEVMRRLGIGNSGSSHAYLSQKVRSYAINTSHFGNRPRPIYQTRKKTPDQLLVKTPKGSRRVSSLQLRRALIESGRDYICEDCRQEPIWNGQVLRLEIDHKNQDNCDNRLCNLRFLCPNCHSQKPHKMNKGQTGVTTCTKPGVVKRRKAVPKRIAVCIDCGKAVSRKSKLRCKTCSNENRPKNFKINWPTFSNLTNLVNQSNHVQVGRMLGVSDNAVRKRLERYSTIS